MNDLEKLNKEFDTLKDDVNIIIKKHDEKLDNVQNAIDEIINVIQISNKQQIEILLTLRKVI
jgi:hypothetical protein